VQLEAGGDAISIPCRDSKGPPIVFTVKVGDVAHGGYRRDGGPGAAPAIERRGDWAFSLPTRPSNLERC
jgi:hypothetical protein